MKRKGFIFFKNRGQKKFCTFCFLQNRLQNNQLNIDELKLTIWTKQYKTQNRLKSFRFYATYNRDWSVQILFLVLSSNWHLHLANIGCLPTAPRAHCMTDFCNESNKVKLVAPFPSQLGLSTSWEDPSWFYEKVLHSHGDE